jgi:hypothetical protein
MVTMNCDACYQTASAIGQARVQNQVLAAIAKKSLDVQKLQGQAAVELISQVSDVISQLDHGQIDVQL